MAITEKDSIQRMHSTIRVSIIIPVFNLEKYIERNILSVLCQDYDKLEIIYVDDGSCDTSAEIIERYALQDDRIILLKQENRGQAVARNQALKIATGEIIMYVDGDDCLAKHAVKTVVDNMTEYNLDLLQYGMKDVSDNDKNNVEYGGVACEFDLAIHSASVMRGQDWLLNGVVNHACCAYAYKSSFLRQNDLYFVPGIFHEDTECIVRALYVAERFMRISCTLYLRTIRPGSTTQSKNLKRSYDLLTIVDKTKDYIISKQVTQKMLDGFFLDYIGFLYAQSIHSCILMRGSVKKLLESKDRDVITHDLSCCRSRKYNMMGLAIHLRLMSLYALLYRVRMKWFR